MKEISDAQARNIIQNREIPEEIINSAGRVAVVLTQDWCPQWMQMKGWLEDMKEEGINVFHISYNRKPYFREFMMVKESQFGNGLVPYVRYYINGQFLSDSNFISRELFLSRFKGGNYN